MDEEDKVFITGELVSVSSRFWDGWGFARVLCSTGKEVKITGALEGFAVGTKVSVHGVWKQNDKYGAQINVVSIVAEDPTDQKGVQQWMRDRLPNIGDVRSAELVKRFGAELWGVIQNEPLKLTDVAGITVERAYEIRDAYELYAEEREHYVSFYKLGVVRREAKDLYEKGVTIDAFMSDPFESYFLSSFTFSRLDKIREEAGVGINTKARVRAAIVEAMKRYAVDGHTAVTHKNVIDTAGEIGKYGDKYLGNALQALLGEGILVLYDGLVMLEEYDAAEAAIAEKITLLLEEG